MDTILHRIKATLYDNILTDDPNDYIARVSAERSLTVEDICNSASNRGGADVSAPAMSHAVNLFLKEMAYQLCDGFSVNTGYFTAVPQIRGAFHSSTEQFTAGKHTVLFQFTQGEALRKLLPEIGVDILGVADSSLAIAQVIDVKTGSINDKLTPERNLRIKGYKLKLSGDAPEVGIRFVNQTTGERFVVDGSDIVTNTPSELVVIIPALAPGTYTLEVTTQFVPGYTLKEPRSTSFEKLLTVE